MSPSQIHLRTSKWQDNVDEQLHIIHFWYYVKVSPAGPPPFWFSSEKDSFSFCEALPNFVLSKFHIKFDGQFNEEMKEEQDCVLYTTASSADLIYPDLGACSSVLPHSERR